MFGKTFRESSKIDVKWI